MQMNDLREEMLRWSRQNRDLKLFRNVSERAGYPLYACDLGK